jgi:hypothetical protein
MQPQVTHNPEVVATRRLRLPAEKADGGIALDIKEVPGAEMEISLLLSGIQTGRSNLNLDTRQGQVCLIKLNRATELIEAAFDGADHQVADGELDLAVGGIDDPVGKAIVACPRLYAASMISSAGQSSGGVQQG